MIKHTTNPTRVLALDVGKYAHWAFALDTNGEITINHPIENTQTALDNLYAQTPPDTLVVVDQKRNIAHLAITRAHAAGLTIAYLPGLATHQAAKMFPGHAKNDQTDATIIARTALGIPDTLLPIHPEKDTLQATRLHATSRDWHTATATRAKNRLRAILLESCPNFENIINLSDPHHLAILEKLGSPWTITDTPPRNLAAITRGAKRETINTLHTSTHTTTRPHPTRITAENHEIKTLATQIRLSTQAAHQAQQHIETLLENNTTYQCLLTIPGIGPSTAAELVTTINIENFPDHHHLASYCGLAPTNKQSGKSIHSITTSHHGNKRLKNLLIFSCNSIIESQTKWGHYYQNCRKRGMKHKQALKATARNRIKTIYAIMKNNTPYTP